MWDKLKDNLKSIFPKCYIFAFFNLVNWLMNADVDIYFYDKLFYNDLGAYDIFIVVSASVRSDHRRPRSAIMCSY